MYFYIWFDDSGIPYRLLQSQQEEPLYEKYEVDKKTYEKYDSTLEKHEDPSITEIKIAALLSRQEFLEDCIAEMAMQVYS